MKTSRFGWPLRLSALLGAAIYFLALDNAFPKSFSHPLLAPGAVGDSSMSEQSDRIVFSSDWLRLEALKDRPEIAFLSWDCLGKGDVKTNLLKVGKEGGFILNFARNQNTLPHRLTQPAEVDGNVIRYRAEAHGGILFQWEIRCNETSVDFSLEFETPEGMAFAKPPSFEIEFDLKVSSIAPLAKPQPGPPAPLPLPVLLHHGTNGTILLRQDEGQPSNESPLPLSTEWRGGRGVRLPLWLDCGPDEKNKEWTAKLIGPTTSRPDGMVQSQPGKNRWEFSFSVEKNPVALPEIVAAEPRLWALPRHWINGFQYRPDLGLLSNHIVSTPCANCLFYQSAVATFTPTLPGGIEAMDLVRASADRYLKGLEGYSLGDDSWMDTDPSLIMACWEVVRVTGDMELLKEWLPHLERRAAHWKTRDTNNNGLYESTRTGNRGGFQWPPCNAWDCANFGFEDAYSIAMGYRALRGLADLERIAGRVEQGKVYDRDADRIKAAYVPTFLNPATGILAGWKSQDGELHDYWFTFINGIAIAYGLVPDDVANDIMDRILAKMKEVGYQRFDLGMPWNLVPIHKNDYHPNSAGSPKNDDGSDTFGIFVNGGAHAQNYFFIQALYQLGRREEADKIFWAHMDSYAHSRFQNGLGNGGELTTWEGKPSGYEGYLAHCYRTPLAFYTGYSGVRFGPEGFRLQDGSPLKGKKVKLGLKFMGKVVDEIE